LLWTLHWREVVHRPPLELLLVHGTADATRDLFGRPRVNLPAGGEVRLHYAVAGEKSGAPRPLLRRWFRRFTNLLGPVLRRAWSNEDVPLASRLPQPSRLLFEPVSLLDVAAAGALALAAFLSGSLFLCWYGFRQLLGWPLRGLYPQYVEASRRACDLTAHQRPAGHLQPDAEAEAGTRPQILVH